MTTVAVRGERLGPGDLVTSPGSPGGSLAGTGTLARFTLRRERVKLPVWLVGITGLCLYFASFLSGFLATEEQRQDVSRFMEGGLGALFGPGYGRDALTPERYLTGVYGLFFFVLSALMSSLLVTRHTRADEQSGRAELVRANAVGRHAPLTAALLVAVGANGVLALLLGGAMALSGHGAGDGLLFGASVGAVGLAFAGVCALTAQVTAHARAATGMAGAVLGAAWAVRAAGDMLGDHGSALSWFSPLAWSNQTRPYVDGRWWPLLLSIAAGAAAAGAGYVLSGRRDLGAGLIPARPGPATAAPWLRSPVAAALRLQRTGLVWWTTSLAAFGLVFGALADQIADPAHISEDRVEMFGGSIESLVEGYLGVITLLAAALVGVMVVLGVQALRAEEVRGRAEPVLATATSRGAWLGGWLLVASLGATVALTVAGLSTGLGAAAATGDGAHVRAVVLAHLAHTPGVLALVGLAASLFGLAPRALGLAWAVVGYGVFVAVFGTVVDHPQWLQNLVPMAHTGQPPLESASWTAMVALGASAALLALAGAVGLARRDLDSR